MKYLIQRSRTLFLNQYKKNVRNKEMVWQEDSERNKWIFIRLLYHTTVDGQGKK
mgnify:FL=1